MCLAASMAATLVDADSARSVPDAPDLEAFAPQDSRSWCILLQALFGPEHGEGEESFDVLVCTRQWLSEKLWETASSMDGITLL
ncbi:MAG: Imm8 family immunity protein [Steroidobacteraceae bacterium]